MLARDDFDPLAPQREAAFFYGLFLRGHSVEALRQDIDVSPVLLDKWLKARDFEESFRESLQRVYYYRKQVLLDGVVVWEADLAGPETGRGDASLWTAAAAPDHRLWTTLRGPVDPSRLPTCPLPRRRRRASSNLSITTNQRRDDLRTLLQAPVAKPALVNIDGPKQVGHSRASKWAIPGCQKQSTSRRISCEDVSRSSGWAHQAQ